MATLQREHARSQQKMGALLESRAKNVGDIRQQLEHQIDSLKSQLETSQVRKRKSRSFFAEKYMYIYFCPFSLVDAVERLEDGRSDANGPGTFYLEADAKYDGSDR